MPPSSTTLAVLLAVALSAGCGPGLVADAGGGCGTGPGRVEVARGGSRALALPPEGGELPIVLGSQGGIHVVVGAWVEDMDLDLALSYRLEELDGSLVVPATELELGPSLFRPDGDRHLRNPDLVVLDDQAARVEDFAGRLLDLVAEARSVDGSHACDRRRVTLTPPP